LRIFGPKRDEVTGEWRKLHIGELNGLYLTKYCSGDQIQKTELGGACSAYGEKERCIQGLVGKPKGKRALGKPRRRWDDIKMDLKEVGCRGMHWTDLAEDRDRWRAVVNAVMILRVP